MVPHRSDWYLSRMRAHLAGANVLVILCSQLRLIFINLKTADRVHEMGI